VSKDKEITGI